MKQWMAALLLGCCAPATVLAGAPAGIDATATATAKPGETASNRRMVEQFVDLFYRQRKVREAFEAHVSAEHYIQHNPGLPDGREAAIIGLEPKFQAPGFLANVQRIIVEGDLAMVHLQVKPGPDHRGAAVVDIFRIHDGRIVEHWDVLQPVPERSANAHPMF